MTRNFRIYALVFLFVLAIGFGGVAYANPSSFGIGVRTNNAASTTPAFIGTGTGTSTTPVYDSLSQTTSGGQTSKSDLAGLLVRYMGSSTASVLKGCPEYSQDGVDWFLPYLIDSNAQSTTTSQTIGDPHCFTWKAASSTVGGVAITATNASTSAAAILIPTPFRYTRVVFTMTGAPGAVWAQLVPIKEVR